MNNKMSDIPRLELAKIIKKYGEDLCQDARKCEAFLKDLCGRHKREIFILVSGVRERIPEALQKNAQNPVSFNLLLGNLTKRLRDNLGLSPEAAVWCVETWTYALELNLEIASNSPVAENNSPEGAPPPLTVNKPIPTFVVSSSGKDGFRSITDALDYAPPHSRIEVHPGRYEEIIVINKPIEIVGKGSSREIIISSKAGPCIRMETSSALISCLSLKGMEKNSYTVEISKGCLVFSSAGFMID